MGVRAVLVAALVLVPLVAAAAPGDFRVIEGTLVVAPQPPGAPVARVDGDDGVTYYADLRGARWDPGRLLVGARVTLAGYEGVRPDEITAAVLDPTEGLPPAASAPTGPPQTAVVPPTPPPSRPPSTAAPGATAAPPAPREPSERVEGRVERIEGNELTLRTPAGSAVRIDLSQVQADVRSTVRPGERVTVFGRFTDGERRLVANGFYLVHTR
jgi:hypothetical protein